MLDRETNLSRSVTAVFMGVNSDDYGKLLEDLPHVEPWMGIGTAYCGVANRISYPFEPDGIKYVILSRESKVAIVGEVNAIFGPGLTTNGYGRGEGAVVAILKGMAEAVMDGDHILAVLKGTAVAQDGHTNGIMAPDQKAQELVARKALEIARVDPNTVDYVEAHATSTPVSDPTEVSAISTVYGKGRRPDKPSGADAVGFIRAVMSVQKGILPPQSNLKTLNTKVDWSEGVPVVRQCEEWPDSGYPRRAGVCSYGYGGTVSHGIIEQYIEPDPPISSKEQWPKKTQILLHSAPQRRQLEIQAATHVKWISIDGKQHDLGCVATTLGTRQNHRKHRAAFVIESHDDSARKLSAFACQSPLRWSTSGGITESDSKPVVWVFSGHGAQWADMAQELLRYSIFRSVVDSVDTIVQEEMGFSAIQAMKSGVLGGSDQVQVLTYLMQIGLSGVLRSQGVSCNAVIGHSVGEIAASIAAGRAKLHRLRASFEEMTREINIQDSGSLVAAIISSPSSCVVSGPKEEVEIFGENLKSKDIKIFRVDTDIAFHHPILRELIDPLAEALDLGNMINPVQLTSAVAAAAEDRKRLFLEISPHRIVSHSIEETLLDIGVGDFIVTNTMLRETPAERTILYSMAQLHCQGANVDWNQHMRDIWAPNVPITTWNHRSISRQIQARSEESSRVHEVDKHNLLGQRTSVAGDDIIVYETRLDRQTKPFPGRRPVHGWTGARVLYNLCLRIPIAVSEPRQVQLIVQSNQSRLCTYLVENNGIETGSNWLTHTTSYWTAEQDEQPTTKIVNIEAVKARINNKLKSSFSIGCLASVGVSDMGFPWAVTEHHGDLDEMVARVDVSPNSNSGKVPWDTHPWAPILDSATSVASTLFFDMPRLRMPAHVEEVRILVQQPPPKIALLYIKKATDSDYTAHISICNGDGTVLIQVSSMRFSEIDGTSENRGSLDGLVHQLAWSPTTYSESPLHINHIILMSRNEVLANSYVASIDRETQTVTVLTIPEGLSELAGSVSVLNQKNAIITYIPGFISSPGGISAASQEFVSDLLDLVRLISISALTVKVFVLAQGVLKAESVTSLAQTPLHGLSRIIASEVPDTWGALIDLEVPAFPLAIIKDIQQTDIVQVSDGIPRVAPLRPIPRSKALPPPEHHSLLPHPSGTYLITGGLGDLGLATAESLVQKGARRTVLVSCRPLPHRRDWASVVHSSSSMAPAIQKIQSMETRGATIQAISVDIASHNAVSQLSSRIDDLFLRARPYPKVAGSLTLNTLFPPNILDLMVLFSSCGQFFGFPGQVSYASGNAFLDALATYRSQGDNTVAMQWTSWNEIGMATSSAFVKAELATKGITGISREEAFQAWMHISKYLHISSHHQPPLAASRGLHSPPLTPADRLGSLSKQVRECVANVLQMESEEVASQEPLSNMGMDSVMTVLLRGLLQKALGVLIPPNLTWSHPTVDHIAK
ncbi:hypothetical protein BDV23DRAFT_174528 [Aspergillus alliaceus]|uniref:Carrier domain-containing protein n=1 Tax=Petromyces alliaceus TaxID=209559 RepID=A0A5N7C1I9_PETAA|nr:hypothetical protein BDV23DRAFT_174528 [Aspergillus alliaceus]